MAVSFSAAADSCAAVLTEVFASTEVFAAGVAAAGVAETFPETEAAGPLADRFAAPAPERRAGGEAVAPVAARAGLGTALPAAAFVPLTDTAGPVVAAWAPVAASDAFVLLVVTAVILAL